LRLPELHSLPFAKFAVPILFARRSIQHYFSRKEAIYEKCASRMEAMVGIAHPTVTVLTDFEIIRNRYY
jgi:hypothetical protein